MWFTWAQLLLLFLIVILLAGIISELIKMRKSLASIDLSTKASGGANLTAGNAERS